MDIGTKLRALIQSTGKTQAETAKICGIGYRNFNHYVNNKRNPDYASVIKICNGLNISPNQLFDYAGAIGGLSEEETALISKFRRLSDEQKPMIIASIDAAFPTEPDVPFRPRRQVRY